MPVLHFIFHIFEDRFPLALLESVVAVHDQTVFLAAVPVGNDRVVAGRSLSVSVPSSGLSHQA